MELNYSLPITNAKALSFGNAVTVDPPRVDSIHVNPARRYPDTNSILILADGGGSHSSRRHIFKKELIRISNMRKERRWHLIFITQPI